MSGIIFIITKETFFHFLSAAMPNNKKVKCLLQNTLYFFILHSIHLV